MRQRVRDLLQHGDKLFSKRSQLVSTWQAIAEQLYPERADFLGNMPVGAETGEDLQTGAPSMARRDLADSLSAMLRPREKPWFHARSLNDKINEDATAKQFFDWMSERMRTAMYDKRAQFVRATKQGDNDFACFGQTVIEVSPNNDLTGLLFRNKHLRDVAWCENNEMAIDTIHCKWNPELRQLIKQFPKTVSQKVRQKEKDRPYSEVACRHIVIPAGDYEIPKVGTGLPARKMPFVSIYVDKEHETILEEKYVARTRYVIPRWATVAGSQYAHSPGAVIAYRDARLLQQITLTLLEAGEKVVDPPSVGVAEAIAGGVNLYAGGHTWLDAEYDERLGEAIRYLQIDPSGLQFGKDREAMILDTISKALYLDRIQIPYPEGSWTATEYRGRVEEYVRRALPLFEPMEVEYNGGLCEETFDLLLGMGGFGSPADWPEIVQGQDLRWSFESPLQQANERGKSQAFIETSNMLKVAMELDPGAPNEVDLPKMLRDSIPGTGAPSDWVRGADEAQQLRAQQQQAEQVQAQAAAAAQATQMAGAAGEAAQSMAGGKAAQAAVEAAA